MSVTARKVFRGDVLSWLRANRHGRVAAKIETIVKAWRKQGKKTRRNWWGILAGDKRGRPRKVSGTVFPVIEAARLREIRKGSKSRAKLEAGLRRHKEGRLSAPEKAPRTSSATWAGIEQEDSPLVRSEGPAPKPFVKWAGGKRQLLAAILSQIPNEFGTYHEPFLGGGAVFFALSPRKAFLSDSNRRLVRCYKGIKEHVGDVIDLLSGYGRSRRFFEAMRRRNIDGASDAEVAAWFIFLNKMGFNGLYRVNSKDHFNVPFGDNKKAQICDAENLKVCSLALADTEINSEDFEAVWDRAQPNDLVYFDPPYVPLSATSYFTSYTAGGFTGDDQIRLRNLALRLKRKGVHVLLSNSSSAAELYSKDFAIIEVLAARPVNSKAERRGKIPELLIR